MKIKISLILLLMFQSSFAQNIFFDKIKCVNKNMSNGLEVSDTVFKNILVSLEPISNIFIDKINDSLNLESEIVYYINRVIVSDYNVGAPKYFGFITDLKTDKVLCFKYIKGTWKSDYELTIYEMTPNDYNYQYYSFLIKSSDGNSEEIFTEIDKYRAYFTNISFEGVSDYEFLYVLDGKKKNYKGDSFILSHLIFLIEEGDKIDKFDN